MSRPPIKADQPARERVPCTKKRVFAHLWKQAEPVDGVVRGVCAYCRRKREWPAYMPSDAYGVGILHDPLPKRNNVGEFGITYG